MDSSEGRWVGRRDGGPRQGEGEGAHATLCLDGEQQDTRRYPPSLIPRIPRNRQKGSVDMDASFERVCLGSIRQEHGLQ